MKKSIGMTLMILTVSLSSCSFPGGSDTPKVNKYNDIYVLKDGYTKDDVQGGPIWMNSNIRGDLAKVEKPKISEDFYANVNYEDIIDNKEGFFDVAVSRVRSNLTDLVTSESVISKNEGLISSTASKIAIGDSERIHNKISSMMNDGISDFILSKEAMEMNSGPFYLEFMKENDSSVTFRVGHQTDNLAIQYHGLSIYSFSINYYNWVYDYYGDEYIWYKEYADRLEIILRETLEELYKGAGFSSSEYQSYIDNGIEAEKTLFNFYRNYYFDSSSYTYTFSNMSSYCSYLYEFFNRNTDLKTQLSALGNVKFFTYRYEIMALNYIYGHYNDLGVKALITNRTLFNYRHMLGYETYKKIGWTLAEQELTHDFAISGDDDYNKAKQTYAFIHDAIDYSYIHTYVDEAKKQRVEDLVTSIKAGYKEILQENTWLSDTTKAKAIEKLDALQPYVSYPASIKEHYIEITGSDYSSLFDIYQTYLDNKLNITLNKAAMYTESGFQNAHILTVNAYNNIGNNSIVILQGLLEGNAFGDDTIEGSLATVGMIIGHEISHAFDINGAEFDKNGNQHNWWTAGDKANFQLKANKITRYFDSVEVLRDRQYDGASKNGEASSDMGGLRVTLHNAKKIEGFNYDSFFKQYAKLWLTTYSPSEMEAHFVDSHPLAYLRVNVVVSQFDEFIETYDIKEGDPMYVAERDRIAIW